MQRKLRQAARPGGSPTSWMAQPGGPDEHAGAGPSRHPAELPVGHVPRMPAIVGRGARALGAEREVDPVLVVVSDDGDELRFVAGRVTQVRPDLLELVLVQDDAVGERLVLEAATGRGAREVARRARQKHAAPVDLRDPLVQGRTQAGMRAGVPHEVRAQDRILLVGQAEFAARQSVLRRLHGGEGRSPSRPPSRRRSGRSHP